MKIGTKSLLFGVHQIFLHPFFVFWGWHKLYGWPNWKEFVCILFHDWGYWGCGDMDGEEGDQHTLFGAHLARKYFHGGKGATFNYFKNVAIHIEENMFSIQYYTTLCLYHSRFYSKKFKQQPSRLCWADKLGSALYPPLLWVLLGTLTGEIKEYMGVMKHKDCIQIQGTNPFEYFRVYRDKVVPSLLKEHGVIK